MDFFSILFAQKSNGKLLDNTITFVSGDTVHEIINIKNGNSINAPATNPTRDSMHFVGWKIDGEYVNFPYTPLTNVEMLASFITARNEITYTLAGDIIGEGVRTSNDGGKVIKTHDGVSICGYTINSDNKAGTYYIVSETQDGCAATNVSYVGTVEYEGKVYHYSKNSTLANINYNGCSTLNCWCIGSSTNYVDKTAVTRLLDYYYVKINS
jgi:hypothetical protein